MRFAVNDMDCAPEGMDREEATNRFENILEKNREVRKAEKRVHDIIGCIRDALIKMNATKALELLMELDNEYVNLDTKKLKLLALVALTDIQAAYELGCQHAKLEAQSEETQPGEE